MIPAFRRSSTIEDAVGDHFTDAMLPYLYGGFASGLLVVWIASVTCGMIFAIGVTHPSRRGATLANLSLLTILVLSLFTIWIEPATSVSGAVADVLMHVAQVSTKAVNLGASLVWLCVYFKALAAINRQRLRPVNAHEGHDSNSCVVLRWSHLALGGALVLIVVMVLLAVAVYIIVAA